MYLVNHFSTMRTIFMNSYRALILTTSASGVYLISHRCMLTLPTSAYIFLVLSKLPVSSIIIELCAIIKIYFSFMSSSLN